MNITDTHSNQPATRRASLWGRWTTPHASNRDEAFRERTIRGLTPLFGATALAAAIILFASPTLANERAIAIAMLLLPIAASAALVSRQHVVAAGWLLVGVFILSVALATFRQGWWAAMPYLTAMIVILLASITLPRNHVLTAIGLTIATLLGTMLSQVLNGIVPEIISSIPILPPVTLAIFVVMIFGLVTVMGAYMLNESDNRLEEVNNLVATLEERVAERTKELEAARDAALEADRLKSQFLASMSHELRTPLNAILSFNKLLAKGMFGDVNDEQTEYLNKSVESGKHLLSLINDVLDMTKIQSDMMKLFIEYDFDVAQEVSTIAIAAEKLLGDKPVKLVTDVDSTFPPVVCDKRRVKQILLNLVSNAVKFTEEGTITISAKHRGDEVLFAVIDTGPGISPDQQSFIFEPFVQTETGVKHAGGTGLGLPIARQLAEAHGGNLRVESNPGQGTAFYVTLPLNVELPVAQEI